jgi:cell division septation protein DedD
MRSEPDEWEEMEEDTSAGHPRPQKRLPSRRSRRSRSRKATFGFGQFMLPIVGLVAVGTLVFGIRLFFFPSPNGESLPPVLEQTQSTETGSVDETSSDAVEIGGGESVVAVPEGSAQTKPESAKNTKVVQAKPVAKPIAAKPTVPPVTAPGGGSQTQKTVAPPPQPKTAPEQLGKETWNVQVGAFKDRVNAENLLRKLKQEGFPAKLVEAKSGEATLSKVLVLAGTERVAADKLAKTLSEKGYPVLVVRLP